MTYPEPYMQFLIHFHGERDYFECHEVLEEYWKTTRGSSYSGIWHGLIQVAVALYHERRGNLAGAWKMMDAAVRRLSEEPLQEVGLDGDALLSALRKRANDLMRGDRQFVYEDLNLPFIDSELEEACQRLAELQGFAWKRSSPRDDRFLLNKHTLRDRSPVIQERDRAHALRRGEPG